LEPVELLRQDLAIEPDLQNFIGFVLESVNKLGGDVFAATIVLLSLMQNLRDAGAATGRPMPVSLVLQEHHLLVLWEEQSLMISDFARFPHQDDVAQLRLYLQNSTALTTPDILLQRNAQMVRHLDEIRARTEKEIEALQQAVEKRQNELHESMRQAETDPLTGLLNRRAFDDRLARAFHHTMRQKNAPLSLVLFDLDHFKEINDEFGHQFGDAHLNKMAHILRSVIRENVDFAFRFGGDEFAMVIFADYHLACDKAQQLLQLMDGKVSIGITAINPDTPDGISLESFFRRADSALYEAKHRGRGRTIVDICMSPESGECLFPCPKMGSPNCNRYVEFVGEPISRCPQAAESVHG
jgi:two-component system cell cycle response regulator